MKSVFTLQLPTPAVNVPLPAFAAARCGVAAPATQQSIDISSPPGPQQQTGARSWSRQTGGTDIQTDGNRAVT